MCVRVEGPMQPLKQPCDEGVLRAGKAASPCGPVAERWVLAATILGSSMAFIDGTAVNVALPALQAGVGAPGGGVEWGGEGYALFLSGLLLGGGSLRGRLRRRGGGFVCGGGVALASG